jgi:hypothetical protein
MPGTPPCKSRRTLTSRQAEPRDTSPSRTRLDASRHGASRDVRPCGCCPNSGATRSPPGQRHVRRAMAQNTSTIWPLRHVAPACLALPLRSPRPNTHSRAMDTSRLRCAALCPPPIFQAGRFRARANTHGYARGMGNSAKHRVSLRRRRHISGVVLRDAERAPRFVGPACGGGPCVATRDRCIAPDALDRRFDYRLVVVRRGEAPARRTGDVCASEGTRERMGCPSRTRTRAARREMWESSGKLIHSLVSVIANSAALPCMMCNS